MMSRLNYNRIPNPKSTARVRRFHGAHRSRNEELVIKIKVDFIATCPKCKLFVRSPECHEPCTKCKAALEWSVSTKEGRSQLNRCNKMFGTVFDSLYGPQVVHDDGRNIVEIHVSDEYVSVPTSELMARGWACAVSPDVPGFDGCQGNWLLFWKDATPENIQFAVDWAWRHAGEWFTARKLTQEAKTWLILSDSLKSIEQRPLASRQESPPQKPGSHRESRHR